MSTTFLVLTMPVDLKDGDGCCGMRCKNILYRPDPRQKNSVSLLKSKQTKSNKYFLYNRVRVWAVNVFRLLRQHQVRWLGGKGREWDGSEMGIFYFVRAPKVTPNLLPWQRGCYEAGLLCEVKS